jgi:hypothetical protein
MRREELAEQWRERLAGYSPELGTVKAWCEANQISLYQYYYWQRRFRNQTSSLPPTKSEWLRVAALSERGQDHARLTPASSGVSVRIGTATIELTSDFDERVLGAVLRVLEAAKC